MLIENLSPKSSVLYGILNLRPLTISIPRCSLVLLSPPPLPHPPSSLTLHSGVFQRLFSAYCACFIAFPDAFCRGYSIGMENGKIENENVEASSWQEPIHAYRPESGRLNNKDGTWCPNTLGDMDTNYYLQIEFPARYNICAVATQGSSLHGSDWVTKYRIQFSMDGQTFTNYTENGTVKVKGALHCFI